MDDIRTEVISAKYMDDDNSDGYSDLQGIVLWPRRSLLYRISFLSLMPLYTVFLLGFSSPFWMKRNQVNKYRGHYNDYDKVDVSIGLWRVCEGSDFLDIKDCTPLPITNSYYKACQAMLCLSLIFTTFSIIFGWYENFATMYETEEGAEVKTKWPEMNAIAAGVFGLIGVGLYGLLIIEITREGDGSVHFAFPVTTISVTGFIVCGILMAVSNPINAPTQSYPGQIMSISRQNSLRLREPSIQDRLVVINDGGSQPSGSQTPSTLYGMTAGIADSKENNFLPRSNSCLSSHMSSPDLFSTSSQAMPLPSGQRGTHVVETHETYASAQDSVRRHNVRQQIHNKAAQRRSWHFDDRSGAYIVSDLINTRTVDSAIPNAYGGQEQEVVKPPVPPRRDKMAPQQNVTRSLKSSALQAIPDENQDLMVLDDPVQASKNTAKVEAFSNNSPVEKVLQETLKSTNPFIDDMKDAQKTLPGNNVNRQESWENQPWPDPPSESECLEHISQADGVTLAQPPVPQSSGVPESLQYQPQNQSSISRKQGRSMTGKGPSLDLNDAPFNPQDTLSAPRALKADRPIKKKASTKQTPAPEPNVPVMKEYDNPLFKAPEERRANNVNEEFSLKVCDSTSFISSSPQSPPPSYYTVQGDPASYRRHSSHYSHSPKQDRRDNNRISERPVSLENGHNMSVTYAEHPIKTQGDTTKKPAKPKTKAKPQLNGGTTTKTRPRQVKREHNQRRNVHPDTNTLKHQKPRTPTQVIGPCYGSSPDLVSKSPKTNRRTATAGNNRTDYEDTNQSVSGRSQSSLDYRSSPYSYDSNRQSPYYASAPVNHYHWGDSDL